MLAEWHRCWLSEPMNQQATVANAIVSIRFFYLYSDSSKIVGLFLIQIPGLWSFTYNHIDNRSPHNSYKSYRFYLTTLQFWLDKILIDLKLRGFQVSELRFRLKLGKQTNNGQLIILESRWIRNLCNEIDTFLFRAV